MLADRGLKPGEKKTGRDGNWNCDLRDPDGHRVEFVEYRPGSLHTKARVKFLSARRISDHMLHAGLTVANLDAAMAFYRDQLGFTEIWRGGRTGNELNYVNMRMPGPRGDYVEFMLYSQPPTKAQLGSMHHICLEVPDIQAGYKTAVERGTPAEDRYKPRVGRNRRWQLNLFDPDGTRAELMEPKVVEAAGRPAPQIQALIDRARSTPAEFAADSLLRIASSDQMPDARSKRALLDEAFHIAPAAQYPMKRRSVRTGGAEDRAGFLSRALAQDFDTLTLQCSIVRAMLAVDKSKARELFAEIVPPRPPPLTCADTLGYDPGIFYDTLAEVARQAFTAKEIAEEQQLKFLSGFAAAFTSPAQIGPLARALATVKLTPEHLQEVVTVFSSALRTFSGDDRSFSETISRESFMLDDIGALVAACRGAGITTYPLIEAVRAYLARQLGGTRCQDTGGFSISFGTDASAAPNGTAAAVEFFNDKLRLEAWPAGAAIKPLAGTEISASKLEDITEQPKPPQNSELAELAKKYRGLLFDEKGQAYTNEQKTTPEWQSHLHEYLAAVAAWRPAQDAFHEKCYLLSSLVNVVPNGQSREAAFRTFLEFLQRNAFQQSNRIEWFLPVNGLLARVFTDPALGAIAGEMRNSGDIVISLYAQLETILPRSPARLMRLM
jgi:catechol 2,3-dioxygenase-like lactoylglutathione lyase family enzyme